MLIAFIYDLFRIKRKAIKSIGLMVYIEDLVYWIIVALVMFAVIYYSNEGQLRGFLFIGTAVGVILYILLLSKLVIKISMLVINTVIKILKALWYVLTYPFKIVFIIFRIPVSFIYKNMRSSARKVRSAGKSKLKKAANAAKRFKNIRKKI